MVPSVFIFLESLPLTPSGKVNRRALPEPDSVPQKLEETFVAPRNDLELQLTQIWQRIFGIQQIGIKDNFFELGGHSLLAVRLLSEIQNDLGKNLPLATFFAAQTIEQLATVLAQDGKLPSWSFLVLIQADVKSKKSPLFCIHAVWGNVLFYRKLADHLPKNQPVYGLQAKGLDGTTRPSTSVPEMAANYIEAIRSVQPQGPYYLVGYSFGSIVAFEIAKQLAIQEQEIAMLGIIDTPAPSFNQSSSIMANGTILSKSLTSLTHHLRNLLKLNSVEKMNYITEKVQWHLTVGSFSFFYRNYLRHIKRSLLALQLIDMNLANSQANKMYLASPFPEKLTLFRCNSQELKLTNSPDLLWGNLALGGVEIHEIPGQHTTIMEEPDVRYLAEKLSLCLAKAQEKNG
jgi:thioesterase domain-containing protein/acyl carrier protein